MEHGLFRIFPSGYGLSWYHEVQRPGGYDDGQKVCRDPALAALSEVPRRGYVTQPRVGPTGPTLGFESGRSANPERVAWREAGRNPFGVENFSLGFSQGSRCAATLGYAPKRLWRTDKLPFCKRAAPNFFHHCYHFALPLRILKRPHISLGAKVISAKDPFNLSQWKALLAVIIGF